MISKRLLFKKIAIMAKGQMHKIRGAICITAVDVRDICNSLPRNSQSSGIILVKPKKNQHSVVVFILNQFVNIL